MNLPEFSIHNKVTLTMIISFIVLFGIGSYFTLGFDLMPDMEQPIVTVVTEYPGGAAEDIEEFVTKPMEQAISAVNGIKSIKSTSAEGHSTIIAEFGWGSDLDAKSQDIRDMIEQVKKYLPDDIGNPLVLKINMSQMPVLSYGVCGMKNTNELRKYLTDNVVPRLERIEGVAHAVTVGGLPREIGIFLDRNKVEHYKIYPQQILGALSYGNMNVSGGYINSGNTEYLVRTSGFFKDLHAIENTVIAVSNGALIRIRDIGRVADTFEEGRNYLRVNGNDGVMLAVSKQSGANPVSTIKKIKKTLEELAPGFPSGIDFIPIFDQSRLIEHSTRSMMKNVLLGGLFAVVLLLVFLRDWRPTLAIAAAIPFSILATFTGLKFCGYTLNIMTLSGLALIVGRLVDGAVVVIDATLRHLHEGDDRREAAKKGTTEVIKAVVTSSVVTIAVFVPMALSGGMGSQLTRPQALTICFGLLASLFAAITVVPMIASMVLPRKSPGAFAGDKQTFTSVHRVYEQALRWSLAHRETVLSLAIVVFLVAVFTMPRLGVEFMPSSDYGVAILKIKMPPGTNLAETERIVSMIERQSRSYPETKSVLTSVGPPSLSIGNAGSGTFFPSDVNEATLMIRLRDRKERKRSCDEITTDLRKSFPVLAGASFEFIDISGNSNGGAPFEIKLFGKDLAVLKQKADEGVALIRDIAGLKDINVSLQDNRPELKIIPDRDRATSLGLTAGEIGNAVRLSNFGQVVTRYRDRNDDINIRIQLDKSNRTGIDDLRLIPIVSRFGGATPVANIAEIRHTKGPVKITRENRTRKVTITANLQNRAISSVGMDIVTKLKGFKLPSGYSLEYGGTYKSMFETGWYLSMAFFIALLLVFMIMAALSGSISQSIAIMVAIPLSLIGVVFGLGRFGLRFSSPAFMGVIILVGIVLTNGIVMIDYVNKLRVEGVDKIDAIIRGASLRLRPIVLNTLATTVSIAPLIFIRSEGGEIMKPLAVTVVCGLLMSTILTLFVLPVVYGMMGRISNETSKDAR
jgi:HAE1 family hydrophobic/amphiphilic exporter-1